MIERIKGYFVKEEELPEDEYEEEYEEEEEDSYVDEDEEEGEEDLSNFDEIFSDQVKKKLTVVLISPDGFNDSMRISDELKKHKLVIVNLEEVEYEDARKILDFVSGTVYALGGSINKVSAKIFAFSPVFVEVVNTMPVRRKEKGMDVPRFGK